MRILFVLEYYDPHVGGVEKLFKQLAENLANNGHEVLVITNAYDSSLKKQEVINGVNIKRLSLGNRFLFTFLSFPYITKVAKDFDLIHTTSYNAAFPAWIAGKIRGITTIITFHEVWGKLWFKLPYINVLQKSLFWFYEWVILKLSFDKYVAVSDATKRELIDQGINEDHVIRIYNGIEYPEKVKRAPQKNFTICYLGRLGISKGLEILLPAFKEFVARYPETILKLITPSEPVSIYNRLNRQIDKLGVEKNVIWESNLKRKEIETELYQSSCVVIPSHSEGFCFVAAESAALGVPVISSDKAALKEVVSGRFIKLKKLDTESLIDALELAKSENYNELELKKFTIQQFIDGYIKLYRSL